MRNEEIKKELAELWVEIAKKVEELKEELRKAIKESNCREYLDSSNEVVDPIKKYYGRKGLWKTSHCGSWDLKDCVNKSDCDFHQSAFRYGKIKKNSIDILEFERHNSIYWTFEKIKLCRGKVWKQLNKRTKTN